jgi:hypothetical protein
MDPHDILGVPPNASPDEVRQAYRDLVKVWHPDRFPGDADLQRRATEKLKQINAAHAALSGTGGNRRTRTGPRQRPTNHTDSNRGSTAPPPPPPPRPPENPGGRTQPTTMSFSRWVSIGIGVLVVAVSIGSFLSSGDRPSGTRPTPPPPSAPPLPEVQRGSEESSSVDDAEDPPLHDEAVAEREESAQELDALISRLQSESSRRARVLDGAPAPTTTERPPGAQERPENGDTLSLARGVRGLGELTVVNGTTSDAEVKLAELGSPSKLRRHFYVHGNARHAVGSIAPGDYELVFRMGEAWSTQERRFMKPLGVSRVNRVLNWTEEVTPDGIRYGHREVTLHPGAGGTVRLASFSGEEFDAIR